MRVSLFYCCVFRPPFNTFSTGMSFSSTHKTLTDSTLCPGTDNKKRSATAPSGYVGPASLTSYCTVALPAVQAQPTHSYTSAASANLASFRRLGYKKGRRSSLLSRSDIAITISKSWTCLERHMHAMRTAKTPAEPTTESRIAGALGTRRRG